MTEETKSLLPAELTPILAKIEEYVPKMIAGRDKALARMQKITVIEDDDDLETVNEVLIRSKGAYETFESWRKEITGPLDELKQGLMQYEKDVKGEDARVRSLVQGYNQAKVDAKKKEEEEAAKRKQKEDHKVDIQTQVKKNLTKLFVETAEKTDQWSKKFFNETTLANFEARATQYKSIKPNLKQEFYDACFQVAYNPKLLDSMEWNDLITATKKEEPYSKWMAMIVETITPILKQYRDAIPEFKAAKVALEEATGERKIAIEKAQKEEADRLQAQKDKMFAETQAKALTEIDDQAEISKVGNAFAEQGTVQQLDKTGPTKKILRFTDHKLMPKAFCNVIVQVLINKKFKGIYKADKDGVQKVDAAGNPEYIDGVSFWMDEFMKYCDVNIEGTEVKEVAKVIVRK